MGRVETCRTLGETGVRSQGSGVRGQGSGGGRALGFNPNGIAYQSPGLFRAAGLPWELVFYTIYPNRGCEIIVSRDGAADRGGRVFVR
jgi:hypothetical protein